MEELLQEAIGEGLYQIILSNPTDKENMSKVKIRPVILQNRLCFQETTYIGAQVFHENFDKEALIVRIMTRMSENFRQCEIETTQLKATVLVSKKGKVTINKKAAAGQKKIDLSHNRVKAYILEEERVVPFLVDLGVQTLDGKVVKSRYDKFKQINRFLEFIEDILPTLPRGRTIKVIDFGCGKSYLTFAIYYYLKILQGLEVEIIGLDLKKDVILRCNALALKYGYESLRFLQGDISTFEEAQEVDMVVTLHACDTATDYALAKAVGWNAKVILSVPCCQHEVNRQIACEELTPALKYGLIKERMAALLTDAIRANILEEQGYEVQILEFIDMEHTPKNILIRGIRKPEKTGKHRETNVKKMTGLMNVETTLQKLMQ